MAFLFSNNGDTWQTPFPDQVAQPGEAIFEDFPTEEQLQEAFPARLGLLIDRARAAKYIVLTDSAQAGITGNFASSALGSEHTYPSLSTDQSNLHTGLLSVPDAPTGWTWKLWCSAQVTTVVDGEDVVKTVWDFVEHTVAQLKEVITDYGISLQAFQTHWASVVTLLDAALTLEDIADVNW